MVKSKKKKDELTIIPVEKTKTGNHLTVKTDSNGKITLEWDWDALLNEVISATGVTIKTKKKTKK